jgi:hypothetical protein
MCAFRRFVQAGAKDTAAEFGSGFNTKAACPADLASEVWQTRWEPTLIKKKSKFSSNIRKFRWDQLKSHI